MGVRPRIRASRTYVTLLVLVLLLAAGAVAAGCGGETGDTGDGGTAGASPKAGGAINIAFQSEPVTLDPAISWDVAGWTVEDSVFNALYRYAPKAGAEGTELIPDLAVDMPEISADGTTYTIKLRPDAKFAPPVDRAVTAEDVKYSFERMMTEPRCPATYFYEGVVGASDAVDGKTKTISGVKVVDPQTIQFQLTSPDLSFLYALSMEFCDVVPKEWVAKWGKQVNRHPLGTGPVLHGRPGRRAVRSSCSRTPTTGTRARCTWTAWTSPSTSRRPTPCSSWSAARWTSSATTSRRPTCAGHHRPAVEALRVLAAADRHDVPVHERDQEAVRRRQGAAGAELGDRPRQAGQAAERPGGLALPDLPAEPARQRAGQGLLRLRPGQGQGPARRGRLSGRLQDRRLHEQRRSDAQAGAVDPGGPQGDRRGRGDQDDGPRHLLQLLQRRGQDASWAPATGSSTSPTRWTGSSRSSPRRTPCRAA